MIDEILNRPPDQSPTQSKFLATYRDVKKNVHSSFTLFASDKSDARRIVKQALDSQRLKFAELLIEPHPPATGAPISDEPAI